MGMRVCVNNPTGNLEPGRLDLYPAIKVKIGHASR